MSNTKKNLGHVTAYAYYKAGGGTMTEEEFTEYMADFGDAAERAVDAASEAAQSKADAQTAATNATNSAAAALTSEENANGAMMSAYSDANRADTAADTATSAKNDAVSAKTAAQSAKTSAETAASTATTKASEAAASATTASTAASTATTKAGEAATSATNAAASAQSVASSAAQITQNAEDIDALKEELNTFSDANIVAEPVILDATTANYKATTGTSAMYVSDRIIPTGSFISSIDIWAKSAIKVVLINSANAVVQFFSFAEYGSLQTYPINYYTSEDVRFGFIGQIAFMGQISNTDEAINTAGLYESTNNTPTVGDVLTINKTSSSLFRFCVQWHYSVYQLLEKITNMESLLERHSDALADGAQDNPINMLNVLGFEKGYFYEWNTGTKKANETWGNIKIPISQGEQVIFKTASTKALHLTRWLNGSYVSGYSTGSAPSDYRIDGDSTFDEIIISSTVTALQSASIIYSHNVSKVYYINNGDSIKSIMAEAIKTYGSTVYINAGTYDIIEEYGGTEAINNMTASEFGRGIVVGNGIKIVSCPAAKIICNYTGTNASFKTVFSPFTAHDESNHDMNGDFEIIGLNIEASNCRYAFHDDLGYATTTPYRHVFRDCHFSFDNSENDAWNGDQCIGGGLGDYGLIEIYNCEFETVQTKANECNDVSYHANARNSNPLTESNVYIKDCWFSHTFSARYYNTFETVSNFYMSNCSVAEAPYVRGETSASTVVNVALKAWNNEIRN